MTTKICPHCNQQHRLGARFCPTTGRLMPIPSQPAAPGSPPPYQDHDVQAPPPNSASGGKTGLLPSNSFLKGRYIILEKVGHGGMAAVYKATDTQQTGNLWAIKEMSDAALSNPQERDYAIQSFQREAELLRKLDHPNLPKVVDAFTETGKHYLVMEFVPGDTLENLLTKRKEPYSQVDVLPWAMQLSNVLCYLHGQSPKIIFRDIKPSNIMLTPQGQIKLIDFGIVRFFKPGKAKDTMALGTPGYASPEAIEGQTDERSDLYSLCVVLHQLLSGQNPAEAIYNLPPVRQLNPGVSPDMERILKRGLQNDRKKRWRTVDELRDEMARLGMAPWSFLINHILASNQK